MVYDLKVEMPQNLEDELSEIIKNNGQKENNSDLSVSITINEAIKQYIQKYNNEKQHEFMHEELEITNLSSESFRIVTDQLTNSSNMNKENKIISDIYAQLSAEFSNVCKK